MMKIHTKVCLGATLVVALLAESASAGTIAAATPDLTSPGLGNISVPLVLTTTPNNDDSADPNSGNNIQVTHKGFDNLDYIDILFTVVPSSGTTEYRVIENVDNNTGVDWSRYQMFLGFGLGALFTPSTAGDGLDFDTGLPGNTPPPTSAAFPIVSRPNEDTLVFSGGVHSSLAQGYEFRIDVPDLLLRGGTFILRQIPIPEPGTFMLASLAALAFANVRRRS